MSKEQKQRMFSVLKNDLTVILVGIGYFLVVKFTGFSIPCLFHLVTGKYCPGWIFLRHFVPMRLF